MEWGTELVSEIVALLERGRQNIIVLVPGPQFVEGYIADLKRNESLRVRIARSNYLELTNGSWILFHDIHQTHRLRGIGVPHYVYWPTENFDYKCYEWLEWVHRTRYAPLWQVPDLPSPTQVEVETPSKSVWQHLLEDE